MSVTPDSQASFLIDGIGNVPFDHLDQASQSLLSIDNLPHDWNEVKHDARYNTYLMRVPIETAEREHRYYLQHDANAGLIRRIMRYRAPVKASSKGLDEISQDRINDFYNMVTSGELHHLANAHETIRNTTKSYPSLYERRLM